ncbi:MAG: NUDIX hydrolase, partial [Candidatus Parvarchaeum sp.]
IVDTPKGILIASHRNTWLLPGGGANKGESREQAAIRELREETGLRAINCKYLFEYNEPDDGRRIRNLHKVFLIEASGVPKPNHHDVHRVAYWLPKSNIQLSRTTKIIVDRYMSEFK